jgi:low affinity Fe/Cu permease
LARHLHALTVGYHVADWSTTMSWFANFARQLSIWAGRAWVFVTAVLLVLLWGISGPLFGFSDTWQLVINTSTTIITFLMVFLIQNTQNRDTAAMQIKLDELLRATEGAHNALLDLEELEEQQLEAYRGHYEQLAKQARSRLQSGELDIGTPDVKADPVEMDGGDKASEA